MSELDLVPLLGDSGTHSWVSEQFGSRFDEFWYGIFELTGLVGVPTGVNSEQKHDFLAFQKP